LLPSRARFKAWIYSCGREKERRDRAKLLSPSFEKQDDIQRSVDRVSLDAASKKRREEKSSKREKKWRGSLED